MRWLLCQHWLFYGVNAGATKADGLPDGVAPADVKMLFGTYNTLALTTCSGEAWVLALDTNLYGDNSGSPATNNQLWHRVHTNATTTLDNVVAIRGNGWRMLMALTATGEVYTWGGNYKARQWQCYCCKSIRYTNDPTSGR